ncbi:Rha family transcriptional regulator [Sutcliffiella horikoshii]|uniref:Rha family transcriptional regulator n=1 Tax=Sutcliffiella horikoshii TaxID=79883 RepID=UPI00204039EB|nr:Rha family transcriptional regulator [Sutcliffiella horikoshii]
MSQVIVCKPNNSLVYIENDRPLTDSLRIAEAFEKKHDKVLRDIRNLKCSEEFRLANFGESSYTNQQGRKMPLFIISHDGFAILAMGWNGEKAMEFKERYIHEFNRTRQILESQQQKKLLLELEQRNTLLSYEQRLIQLEIRSRITSMFDSLNFKARRKFYARLHADLKRKYSVTSFRDISRKDLENAVDYIKKWDSPKLESRQTRGI